MSINETNALVCECSWLMFPNVSTGDNEGYLWICMNPNCTEWNASELEAEDLEALGVPNWVAVILSKFVAEATEGL